MEVKVELPEHYKIEGLTQKPEVKDGEEEKGSADSGEASGEATEAADDCITINKGE